MLAPLLLCHLMLGLQHNLLAAQGELKRIVLCTEFDAAFHCTYYVLIVFIIFTFV